MTELKLWKNDVWLDPYKHVIVRRHEQALIRERELRESHASLADTANGYLYYGLHHTNAGWTFREWVPGASAVYFLGECNGWYKSPAYALQPTDNGNWEINFPPETLEHGMCYKLLVEWKGGSGLRLPAYTTRAVQDAH
ncbi:MAG: 1,4-alpha-glucan-branching enzyme, partial [Prevotellaceae bacterium]|nr:1,4-alpha-glucan-branching enzyme [Prevotellaceae bacterium]